MSTYIPAAELKAPSVGKQVADSVTVNVKINLELTSPLIDHLWNYFGSDVIFEGLAERLIEKCQDEGWEWDYCGIPDVENWFTRGLEGVCISVPAELSPSGKVKHLGEIHNKAESLVQECWDLVFKDRKKSQQESEDDNAEEKAESIRYKWKEGRPVVDCTCPWEYPPQDHLRWATESPYILKNLTEEEQERYLTELKELCRLYPDPEKTRKTQ